MRLCLRPAEIKLEGDQTASHTERLVPPGAGRRLSARVMAAPNRRSLSRPPNLASPMTGPFKGRRGRRWMAPRLGSHCPVQTPGIVNSNREGATHRSVIPARRTHKALVVMELRALSANGQMREKTQTCATTIGEPGVKPPYSPPLRGGGVKQRPR